jgi:mitotic spindle assembly checkpoint protein MAD2
MIMSSSSHSFYRVKKYGLNMLGKMMIILHDKSTKLKFTTVSQDDQVKAYIKKIMSQLNKWMLKSKISKLIIVITSKETGEPVERWQFDVCNTLALTFTISD